MPLRRGTSNKSFVQNIREIMHAFAHTGRIGNSRPSSSAKANKQAVAVAYRQQEGSKRTVAHGRHHG